MLTVKVPYQWAKMLDIDDLETYRGPLAVSADSCTCRISQKDEQGRQVELELCSGLTNYWLTTQLWQGGDIIYQGEPEDCLVAGKQEITTPEGEDVTFLVEFEGEP